MQGGIEWTMMREVVNMRGNCGEVATEVYHLREEKGVSLQIFALSCSRNRFPGVALHLHLSSPLLSASYGRVI